MNRLLAYYEQIADAPDAIPRLRRFVLDLAVRGKLVRQEPTEVSPVPALRDARRRIERAAARANRLRWQPSKPLAPSEEPIGLPPGWAAARINDTGLYINGLAFKPSEWKSKGLPIIRIQNLTDASKEFNYAEGKFPTEVIVESGDILVSWSGTLDAFKWNRGRGVLNQHIFRLIRDEELTHPDFLLFALQQVIRSVAGGEHARGLVMTHINRGPFLNHVIGIPPLAEQNRIVAKVDELMALCDRLEAVRVEREAIRDRLSAASLARLNTPDPETFRDDARFALDALPALTARPDQIKQLRQTILNLAVRGKLVAQDANDEPASELLTRIAAGAAGVRRDSGQRQPLHDVPTHWRWAKLGELITFGPQNGLSPKPTKRPDAPKAITLTATTSGTFSPAHFKHVDASAEASAAYWLEDGDLLFQRGNTRDYVGIAAIYRGSAQTFLFPDLIIRVRISALLSLSYIHLAAVAPPSREYLSTSASGAQATMPKINQTILCDLPLPIPPFGEQQRIVDKVSELMALCDALEASLTEAATARTRLLEATLADALAPGSPELHEAAE